MTTRMRPFPQTRTRQPLTYTPARGGNPLNRGLLKSVDGFLAQKDSVDGSPWAKSAALPTNKVYNGLRGWDTSSSTYDLWNIGNGPLAAADPWTFAVTVAPLTNRSLSHYFGFGMLDVGGGIDSTVVTEGQYRGLLNFNSNYYFWGNNADWDTGIAFDTDALTHVLMFTHDGTNIYFYRDGLPLAQTARPAAIIATPAGRSMVLGNKHASGTGSPTAVIFSGRVWNRCLSNGQALAYARNEWQVFAPLPGWIKVPSAAPAVPVYGTLGQFDPGLRIAGWF